MNASSSDRLAERLHAFTAAVSRRSGTAALALVEEAKLTPGELKCLSLLSAQDASMSVGEVAKGVGASQPTASRVVRGLVQRGSSNARFRPTTDELARSV